jgi:hypothetical protein
MVKRALIGSPLGRPQARPRHEAPGSGEAVSGLLLDAYESQYHTATTAAPGTMTAAARSTIKATIAQSMLRKRSDSGRPRRSAALSPSRLFEPR